VERGRAWKAGILMDEDFVRTGYGVLSRKIIRKREKGFWTISDGL